ncbi:hypothetical protein [Treponema primitia]|uniref:hypothetical protein n=1 Tax=Treponema primitia TaxID=88058 RepID=UPI0002554E3A|nr:hypothetical protein [Treponema primitia]
MKKTGVAFFMVIMISLGLYAQEDVISANNELTVFYDTELFRWDYNVLGGLNLTLQNINSATLFGINKNMVLAFNQYADTKEYYDSYHRKNIAGNILMWGGLAVVLGGAYYPLFALNNDSDSDTYLQNVQISLGVMLGGLVTELIGTFILPSGQESLFKAVNLYNRHKIKEFESRKN